MKLKLSAIVALALASSVPLGAAEKLTTSTINVYSATPLPSLGLPLNIIPANIQIATPKAINAQSGVSLADYMSTNMQSVSVTEMGGNPWQPEVTFRGYSASPLLGMPQGMSTYVDGVRVNEPFGDVTLWDKIPNFAIGGMQLVPGSNPMYGLNTLGGAIAIQTKSGREAQGVGIEAEYGSWNRQRALVEYGGVSKDGSVDYYIGHQTTKEDGWRQFSPSHLNQTFGKLGWQNEKSKLDLSYIGTDNKLIGNGFTPEHMLSGDRDQIHTRPDWSNNYYHHLALNGSHWLNNDVMLSGNTYYRKSNRHTKNGDLYESELDNGENDHEIYGSLLGTCTGNYISGSSGPRDDCELKGSALNTTHTKQENYGFAGQITFNQDFKGMKNQLIVGTGFDYSKIRFKQNEHVNLSDETEGTLSGITLAETVFDTSREPLLSGSSLLPQTQTTGLTGKQWTASLFATDTLSLNDKWHLNAGVRYNHTKVDNDDTLRGASSPRTLTAVDDYKRLNPSIGITHTPTDKLSIFATYSESSRAPTSIELGCSNPAYGCLLPSAMADDPPLKQVVAKTYDFGARGALTDEVKWNASIYQAMNHQDLQFIRAGDSTSRGYYSNVGRTQRQGLDLGLSGQHDRFKWSSNYSYIRATFDSDFSLVNGSNSSAPDDGDNKNIFEVRKGNRMPSIPEHQFKLRAQFDVTPKWSIGSNVVYFSDQYVIGNENNQHQGNTAACSNGTSIGGLRGNDAACGSGKIKDYTVVNLDTQYNFGGGWKAFAKAVNIFDHDYYVAGRLAETMFDASGSYNDEIKSRGVIPGAPRAAWVGFRYEFGGAPEAK